MTTELMSLEYAEKLAAAWAHLQEEHKRLDEMFKESTGRKPDDVKAILRQMMNLDNLDEIIDPETGRGVKLGKARRQTSWDTLNMPASLVESLHTMNLLDVRTTAIDKLKGTALAVDEAQRYRIDSETAPAFQAVTGETK